MRDTKQIEFKLKFQRYCQPPIPESFAPKRSYKKPSDAFADATVYNLSYKSIPGVDVRCKPIIQYGNLILSSAKMTTDTVHKVNLHFELIYIHTFYI